MQLKENNMNKLKQNKIPVTLIDEKLLMNIAIYNGFYFHFEMFGYIIDYCNKKNKF